MFDIGYQELLILAVLAIIVIGPEDLPHFLRRAGKYIRQIKRQISDIQKEVTKAIDTEEIRGLRNDVTSLNRWDATTSKPSKPSSSRNASSESEEGLSEDLVEDKPKTRKFIPKSEREKQAHLTEQEKA